MRGVHGVATSRDCCCFQGKGLMQTYWLLNEDKNHRKQRLLNVPDCDNNTLHAHLQPPRSTNTQRRWVTIPTSSALFAAILKSCCCCWHVSGQRNVIASLVATWPLHSTALLKTPSPISSKPVTSRSNMAATRSTRRSSDVTAIASDRSWWTAHLHWTSTSMRLAILCMTSWSGTSVEMTSREIRWRDLMHQTSNNKKTVFFFTVSLWTLWQLKTVYMNDVRVWWHYSEVMKMITSHVFLTVT